MTTLEAWSQTTAELTADQAVTVAASGLVEVRPHEPPSTWCLVSDSRVGVVQGDGWEVRVRPRMQVPQLMFLLSYASDPKGWRDAAASFATDDDLFAAVASGFAFHTDRALAPAPIRGYVTVEDRAVMLRGRLRVADQLARWPGLPLPLELSYDEYTLDIAENQLVRGAAEVLLRLPLASPAVRLRLRRIRATLDEAMPASPSREMRAPAMTRLNARYRGALALAELILRGTSVTTTRGRTSSVAFVFDMNKVFEDFLSTALGSALERHGGRVRTQMSGQHLDVGMEIRLVPDITWWRAGACRAVIDAKYKPLTDARFPNADAYQMLAYCTALGLDRGYLVYAKDVQKSDSKHRVRNTGITIDVKAVDVEAKPESVLRQVELLAAQIAASGSHPRGQMIRAA